MKCQQCENEVFLPFRCQYCGGCFCSNHRIPENHDCPQIDQARVPKQNIYPEALQKSASYEYSTTYPTTRLDALSSRLFYVSRKEIGHLAIVAFLVVVVGLSFERFNSTFPMGYSTLVLFVLMFMASFLMHEIAHKVVAQKYGLWAEFRLKLIGATVILTSIVSPFFKVIAPRAVIIDGSSNRRIVGRTSIAGPITNIILAMTLLVVIPALPDYFWMLAPITSFNAWIALINLIPFGYLMGSKFSVGTRRSGV